MVYSVGIDIGSTTVKIIVLNEENEAIYSEYQRHYARIMDTLQSMLKDIYQITGDSECTASITGSGGLKLADHLGIDFVQEVIAVSSAIRNLRPETDVIIELGGEDAKIVFFENGGIEQRMNGICAGGTGAFIDQMASLLQTDAQGLNDYAENHTQIYPIAARCGVFAKSDIQPLINEGVSKEDLAASIFQAVVEQTISGLACGHKIHGNVALVGGPLFFLPALRRAFIETLGLADDEVVFPDDAHLLAARGSAQYSVSGSRIKVMDIIERIEDRSFDMTESSRLQPLFRNNVEYDDFLQRQNQYHISRTELQSYEGNCYLGIDAGSTTIKLVLISDQGELLYSFYEGNHGSPLIMLKKAFSEIKGLMNDKTRIVYSCATGYGETLFMKACGIDEGEVETVAHYYAAKFFEPEVDCVLDIGGQDMKCIRLSDGRVTSIMLNEACSSGCGSFIENFALSMGYSAKEFAAKAVKAKQPVDLGTRCTVFMNSNVKQAQKEGASVEDIAAGLAYSVVKNALYKVIKIKEASGLGDKIVVQGGTFYNDAVLRALELIIGKEVVRPDISGLMGAFGAALIAKERFCGRKTSMLAADEIINLEFTTETKHCQGCQNSCILTVNAFSNGNRHISGNRCEKGGGATEDNAQVPDMFLFKRERLFSYEPLSRDEAFRGEIGIPRVLNMYENYPFWAVFFRQLGFRVVLSPFSDRGIFNLGLESIPSESECYPAKLAHGHVQWLINQGIRTIFYPCVVYERKENKNIQNNFNCPMVISYPENIRNNVEEIFEGKVRFIDPFIAFTNEKILKRRMCEIMQEEFRIKASETAAAVEAGWEEFLRFRADITAEGKKTVKWLEDNNKQGIILAGRPYHLDPEVNHGIPELIKSYGYAVLTEDSVSQLNSDDSALRVTDQWVYHSRLYDAARYVSRSRNLDMIQLNSFGCGLDAVTSDQVQELLEYAGKPYTLLKIDEINNLGAVKIRVRSLFAELKMKGRSDTVRCENYKFSRAVYTKGMQKEGYTILCPDMTSPHFEFIQAAAESCGYNVKMLKSESRHMIETGMKYVNNDACYPAIIVAGQIMEAVLSGEYDTRQLAVLMCQTGGGCRASNYIGFIRKALEDAGMGYIPVISINLNGMEKDPGFRYSIKLVVKAVQSIIYGDLLMKLSCRMRPYERFAGSVNELYERWYRRCITAMSKSFTDMKGFTKNCSEIIREFDNLEIDTSIKKPKVGIVGEVLVKFMPFANNHLVELLEREGAEVVTPSLTDFMKYCISNAPYKSRYLGKPKLTAAASLAGMSIVDRIHMPILEALDRSRHFSRNPSLRETRDNAEKIIQIGNQCGEGWFLAGEMADLIKSGVDNIVCVQPFGCLPNHVAGKGIIKRIKSEYPQANIVAVDYDPGASRVNQLNRIRLMMENAAAVR